MDTAETTDLPDPHESAVQREDESRALALLRGLPDNQQEVIRLKIENGLKYREISEITGLSVTNVGYLLHQGLQTLRKQISG
jgi:RNA polymerase sigma-70 factor (ECF subfamily)